MTNSATRLITLIMLLQRQPNQKAAALADSLGISVRTLHRYIAMLDELGIPVYSERGPAGGFSLVRGYKMPPLIFTSEEAAALAVGTGLAANLWGELYEAAARSALAKLENVLPESQLAEVAWARRSLVASPLPRPGLDPFAGLLRPLRAAIRARKRLRMVYASSSRADATERELDPYVLAYQSGWWYVIGYCHLRKDVRLFRVDRIRRLEPLDADFEVPADFDPAPYLAFEVQSAARVRVRMQLRPEFGYLALNTPAQWESMETQPDGSVIVALSLPDVLSACIFAMTYGPAAEVLEPPELRDMVLDWAQGLVRMYQGR